MNLEEWETLDKKLLETVETNEMRCSRCGLLIPFTFKKGKQYTCPSFTMVDEKPVCYHDYHPEDYKKQVQK